MVRPILPALVLAVLAVAGPAAADDGVPDTRLEQASAAFQATLLDPLERLVHLNMLALSMAAPDAGGCRPYSLTAPGQNTDATDVFEFDPDGCVRELVNTCLDNPYDEECDLWSEDCWIRLVEVNSSHL